MTFCGECGEPGGRCECYDGPVCPECVSVGEKRPDAAFPKRMGQRPRHWPDTCSDCGHWRHAQECPYEANLGDGPCKCSERSTADDAASPEDADNMPGVSRPNYCPDSTRYGTPHSWDSYGDEWRCSFCPAVFRAAPPSDAAPVAASDNRYCDELAAVLEVPVGQWEHLLSDVHVLRLAAYPEDALGGPWEELREALLAHENKVVDMTLACGEKLDHVYHMTAIVRKSREALLALAAHPRPDNNHPSHDFHSTGESDGVCTECGADCDTDKARQPCAPSPSDAAPNKDADLMRAAARDLDWMATRAAGHTKRLYLSVALCEMADRIDSPSDAAPVAWRVEVEKEGDEIIGPVRLFTGPDESWEIQGDGDAYDDERWANLLAEKHNATLYAHPRPDNEDAQRELDNLARKAVRRIQEELGRHETDCKCPACIATGVLYGYHCVGERPEQVEDAPGGPPFRSAREVFEYFDILIDEPIPETGEEAGRRIAEECLKTFRDALNRLKGDAPKSGTNVPSS